ncbi:MAG TPA: metallopeptidase family protein [Stellaceae bacterium]|nr:metallopeptidase family protein [Stellaceae bacterium]
MTRALAPSLADIDALARGIVGGLPHRFLREVAAVVVRVEDFPDADTAAAMRLRDPLDLLGLYRGVPLPDKSINDPQPQIDMVFLYRRPILAYCDATGEPLSRVVRHVLIHEIGHHFGFSDADMARIEAAR